MTDLVGLSGYARSGKDTVAGFLADHGFARAAFADKIREALLLLNPKVDGGTLTRRQSVAYVVGSMGWERAKDEVPEIRQLLQRMGSDMAHPIFGRDCWVRIGLVAFEPGRRVVFTDCRYPLECDEIKARGGQVWRVHREGFGPVNGHPSETALDGYEFDYVVHNRGTLDELRTTVHALARFGDARIPT